MKSKVLQHVANSKNFCLTPPKHFALVSLCLHMDVLHAEWKPFGISVLEVALAARLETGRHSDQLQARRVRRFESVDSKFGGSGASAARLVEKDLATGTGTSQMCQLMHLYA